MISLLKEATPSNQVTFLFWSMASPRMIAETFAQAMALADQHNDAGAREHLAEWQRQCSAVPAYHPRQDALLSKVEGLMATLRERPVEHQQ